jgi:hypothetical protein
MMRYTLAVFVLVVFGRAGAQELFIQSEPASNMPARTWGLRLASDAWDGGERFVTRLGAEVMYGITKDFMMHVQGFASNQIDKFELETYGLYAKYRFYTDDDFKYHFRLAAYAEALAGKQRSHSPSFASKGSAPMVSGGIIATLLQNRMAVSGTFGVAKMTEDIIESTDHTFTDIVGANASLSLGLLVYPETYSGYSDPNINLYAELLGFGSKFDERESDVVAGGVGGSEFILSFGPQLILNSVTRFDLAYAVTLHSSYEQQKQNSFFVRIEHNFF